MDTFAKGRLQFENPFQIQEIVEVVAKHCDFGTLQNFRLASRTCFQGSLKVWREQAVLVVVQMRRGTTVTGMEQAEVLMRMGDPSNDFLQLGSKPFSSYKFLRWQIFGETCGAPALFWDHVSGRIKYLHLDCCRFRCASPEEKKRSWRRSTWLESLQRFIFPGATDGNVAPNMEHLLITNAGFESRYSFSCPQDRPNVNLKTFQLTQSRDHFGYVLPLLLRKMPNLEKYNGPECVSVGSLPLIRSIAVESFGYNVNFCKKLECITVSEVPPLEHGREALQSLPPFSLDLLPNLKRFQIQGAHLAENFKFLQATPNVEVLKIDLLCYDKRNEVSYRRFLQNSRLPPLRNLVVSATSPTMNGLQLGGMDHLEIDFQFSAHNLQILKRWMPNLVVLKTILNDETFPVVCREWSTTLRELALLFGSDVGDTGIVGTAMKDPSIDKHRSYNVTNLEDLREFSFDSYCNQSRLGNASVFHGFLQMARLTNLRICVSAQMSDEAVASLERELQCVQIICNFGPRPHFGNDCCGRLDFYNDAVEGTRSRISEPEPEVPIKKRLRSQK